jgi:hypothetical protein
MGRDRHAMNTKLICSVVLAVAALAAGSAAAKPPSLSGPTALSTACREDAARRIACGLVNDFFRSVNTRKYKRACSLLGAALVWQMGGPDCPALLAANGARRYAIRDARSLRSGTGVLVSVWFPELDHFRELRWLAVVALEAGKPRLVETHRVA